MARYQYKELSPPGLPGIYEEVVGKGNYDGDTVTVSLRILGECSIRLAGVNTPERNEQDGMIAWQYVADRVKSARQLWAWLQLPDDIDGDGRITLRELLATASFRRWPGTLFLDGQDLRQDLLDRGMAKLA